MNMLDPSEQDIHRYFGNYSLIIQRVLKISVRIPIVKGGGKEWTSSLKKLEIGSIKNINFDRVCAPKIIICAPNMTFPPKILKIKTFAPKIKRVQKILPPPIYLGGKETMLTVNAMNELTVKESREKGRIPIFLHKLC